MRVARMMMMTTAAMLVAGCGDGEGGQIGADAPTLAEAQAEIAELDRPKPGEYSQKVEITRLDMPGAPDGMEEQVRRLIETSAQRSYCLSPEDAERGFEQMYRKVTEEENCAYETFEVSGGKINAVLNCEGREGGTARFTMNGAISASGSIVEIALDQSGGSRAMGLGMTMTSQRIGECEGAEG